MPTKIKNPTNLLEKKSILLFRFAKLLIIMLKFSNLLEKRVWSYSAIRVANHCKGLLYCILGKSW